MLVSLPPDYRPSDDEEFMSPLQLEYFRQKLMKWRQDLLREAGETLSSLSEGGIAEPDLTDRASVETDRALELRTRDRARKLISKIDQAIDRIETGTYGYCEESGEPISLRRLDPGAHSATAPRLEAAANATMHGAKASRPNGRRPPPDTNGPRF